MNFRLLRYSTWQKAVRHIASLDCLMSLAIYSKNIGDCSCRPELVDIVKKDGTERKVSFMNLLGKGLYPHPHVRWIFFFQVYFFLELNKYFLLYLSITLVFYLLSNFLSLFVYSQTNFYLSVALLTGLY